MQQRSKAPQEPFIHRERLAQELEGNITNGKYIRCADKSIPFDKTANGSFLVFFFFLNLKGLCHNMESNYYQPEWLLKC